MSDDANGRDPEPPGPWNVVVNQASGEAYRPAEVLIDIADQARLLGALPDGIDVATVTEINYATLGELLGVAAPPNVLVIRLGGDPGEVDEFVRNGVAGRIEDDAGVIHIEHNTVFMADAVASPVWASPVWASPVWASPVWASPVWASPVWASPVWASPVWASGATSNNALPVHDTATPQPADGGGGTGTAQVIILDTGLAAPGNAPLLQNPNVWTPDPFDEPDSNGDHVLDPVAGHGTFIAGLVELATPGAPIVVRDVMEFRGDTADGEFMFVAVQQLIDLIQAGVDDPWEFCRRVVIGMSFAGPMSSDEKTLTHQGLSFFNQIGVVVVAAAGNFGTCDRQYPAAFGDPTCNTGLENVVSVGALGRCGPAPFTNYGPWVRACADGEMLTSSFFSWDEPHGAFRTFTGWAQWSGTSFAVGVVIGALVREMRSTGDTALEVVGRLIDGPGLESVHNLGTVVT